MKVERPPQLWEADTEDERFIPLLGEMLSARLSYGCRLEDMTLNASNVVVSEPADFDDEGRGPAPGDYVALTVSGEGKWESDAVWLPGQPPPPGLLQEIHERLVSAGVRYAYVRSFAPKGSITVFLSRKA